MRSSRLASVGAAVVLLTACSSGASSSRPAASASSRIDPTTTSIVVGPDGSSSVVLAPTDAGGATDRSGASSSATASALAEIDANGPPGSFAPALLAPARSTEIDVEVRAQSSADPSRESIDHLTSVLESVSEKAVEVKVTSPIAGGAHDWTPDELRATADESHAVPQGGGHAALHLLFVHGTLGGDDGVLGAAIRGDTAAIFVDRVRASATPLVGSTGIEVAVVTHEVGHLLGLVDLYLHTGRQDADHPGHSNDRNSVMYWAVESDLVADLLGAGPPRDFDTADIADLETIRNGG